MHILHYMNVLKAWNFPSFFFQNDMHVFGYEHEKTSKQNNACGEQETDGN